MASTIPNSQQSLETTNPEVDYPVLPEDIQVVDAPNIALQNAATLAINYRGIFDRSAQPGDTSRLMILSSPEQAPKIASDMDFNAHTVLGCVALSAAISNRFYPVRILTDDSALATESLENTGIQHSGDDTSFVAQSPVVYIPANMVTDKNVEKLAENTAKTINTVIVGIDATSEPKAAGKLVDAIKPTTLYDGRNYPINRGSVVVSVPDANLSVREAIDQVRHAYPDVPVLWQPPSHGLEETATPRYPRPAEETGIAPITDLVKDEGLRVIGLDGTANDCDNVAMYHALMHLYTALPSSRRLM